MVSYWKTKTEVRAKIIKSKSGAYVMQMDGEKYPFPGHPRGSLLYGKFSKLKHEIKNQIFNHVWALLEEGKSEKEITSHVKRDVLPKIWEIGQQCKYDMLPINRCVTPVQEIWKGFEAVERVYPSKNTKALKEIMCFILQEDDAYRFRVQFIAQFFNPNSLWRKIFKRDPIKDFELTLNLLEHAEVVGDMKERERLLKRVLLTALKDESIKRSFDVFIHAVDWNKIKLTEQDKYFFRAKYFKADYPYLEY